jgi:hypothetical protein
MQCLQWLVVQQFGSMHVGKGPAGRGQVFFFFPPENVGAGFLMPAVGHSQMRHPWYSWLEQ